MCHSFPYSNAFKGLKNIFVEFVTFSVQGYFKKKIIPTRCLETIKKRFNNM